MSFVYFLILLSQANFAQADSSIYSSLISFGGDRTLLNKLIAPNCTSGKDVAQCNACLVLTQKFTRQTSKQLAEQSFYQDYQDITQYSANAMGLSTKTVPPDIKDLDINVALNIGGAGVIDKAKHDWPLMRQQLIFADQNLRSCQNAAKQIISTCSASIAGNQEVQIASQIQKACATQLVSLETYIKQEDATMNAATAVGHTDLDTAKLLGAPEMNTPSDSLHRQNLPVKSSPITPLTPEEMDKSGRNNACYGCSRG